MFDGIDTPFPERFLIHVRMLSPEASARRWRSPAMRAIASRAQFDPPWKPWEQNHGVQVLKKTGAQDIGDVVVDPQREAHRIEQDGFTRSPATMLGGARQAARPIADSFRPAGTGRRKGDRMQETLRRSASDRDAFNILYFAVTA